MDAATLSPRQERGLALAKSMARSFRRISDHVIVVPSQTGAGGYVVDLIDGTCTCADREKNQAPCKHIFAARYVNDGVTMPNENTAVTTKRTTYPQPSWPRYNRAQCEEKERLQVLLRGLCDGIVALPYKGTGRRPIPLRDIVYAATLKVFTTFSGRRATSDLRACETKGLVDRAAHYNSIFRYVERAELTPLLKTLVDESARPLAAVEQEFAIDATGFATQSYVRWFDYSHGADRRVQQWIKLHAVIGTNTNVVTAAEVTVSAANDSPQLAGLVERTVANGFHVKELSADKAYLSHHNLAVVESVGAQPFIPFKSNSGTGGSPAWERLYHLYAANSDDYFAHYHKRSNVESTFSAMKRKFGDNVRSKLQVAQFNEVLLKCICHNLSVLVHSIHELGIEPKFWQPRPVNT